MHRPENNTEPYSRAIFYYNRMLPGQLETTGSIVVVPGLPKKSQQHHHRQHHRQIFLAVAVIVFKVVALVFKGIECFVFNLPAGTPAAHQGLR